MAKSRFIRPARPADAAGLRAIETAAGAAFATVGLTEVAEDEPFSAAQLGAYAAAGRSWVAVDEYDDAIGYVIVDIVDGCAHVEQVSVHPDHQGRGFGRGLLDEVDRWARTRRLPALSLTTFVDVAWNGPLYLHLGFVALADDELGPGLRTVMEAEAAHGLDPQRRVAMRREISPG